MGKIAKIIETGSGDMLSLDNTAGIYSMGDLSGVSQRRTQLKIDSPEPNFSS